MVGKFKLFAMASVMAMAAAPAFAQQDTNALKNMNVGGAQAQLNQKGYTKAPSLTINGAQWDMYRSPNGTCLGFTSFNGLVTDAREADPAQCAPQVANTPRNGSIAPANPSVGVSNGGFNGNNGNGGNNGGNRYNPPGGQQNNNNNNNRFDIASLRNMGVKTAQLTLAQNGYDKSRNINVGGKQWDLYTYRGTCVGFTSMYGTVSDSRAFEARDCNDNNNNNNGNGGFGNNNRRFDANQLRSLRVNTAQDRLRSSGFQKSRSTNIDGKQWDLWYNDDYRDGCIGFTSYNGTVTDADTFSNSRCGDDDRGNGGFGNGGFGNNRPTRNFDLNAFNNMPVNQAKSALGRNGYASIRSIKIDGKQWDLYLNNDYRNSCVGFTSYYGNVTQTRNFEDRDCR